MLPSMPILFNRDSQDAFGNKIEPSTSFFSQNAFQNPGYKLEFQPPAPSVVPVSFKAAPKETKGKGISKKKDQTKEEPPKITKNALETALVRSYYKKVQSRFSTYTNLPTNKFVQFQNILKSFDPNKETPVDLYKKVEEIFGEEHQDIVEEFLLFLKPGQAAEVGRFMDHFAMVQLTGFIQLLQMSLSRKPTVLRKVLRALTTGVNSGNADVMKARVGPHLRSNPRLTAMFNTLFPDERPPDSAYETGTDVIHESFLTADTEYDVWEFDGSADNTRKLEHKHNLDTMYLHGRVFLQHGRMLRAARVSYPYSKEPYRVHARRLAPNHTQPSPSHSDDERPSPKRPQKNKTTSKRTKKPPKSPTKQAKDVNDNTNKDPVTSSPKTVKKKKTVKKEAVEKKEKKDIKEKLCKKDDKKKPEVPKEKIVQEKKKNEVKKESNWTREEDKTMLQVLKGEAGSEQTFGKIRELLPHKSVTEIKERFCHVMNLLQQMAVGEVT